MRIDSNGDIAPIRKIFKYDVVHNPDNTVKVNVQIFDTTATKYCSPVNIPKSIMPKTPEKNNNGVLVVCKDLSSGSNCTLRSTYNRLTGQCMDSEQMAKYLGLVFSGKDDDSVLRITPYESAQIVYTKEKFEDTIFSKKDSKNLYEAIMSVTMDFENTTDEVIEMLGKGNSILSLVSVPIDQFSLKDADKIDQKNKAPVIDNNAKSGIVITSALVSKNGEVRQRISAFDVENEMCGSINTVATQFDRYAAKFTDDQSYHSSIGGAMVRFLKDGRVVGRIDLHATSSLSDGLRRKGTPLDYDSLSVIPCHDFNIPASNNKALVNGVYSECNNNLEDIGLMLLANHPDRLSLGNSVSPLIMRKKGLPALIDGTTDIPRTPTPAQYLLKQRKEPAQDVAIGKTVVPTIR